MNVVLGKSLKRVTSFCMNPGVEKLKSLLEKHCHSSHHLHSMVHCFHVLKWNQQNTNLLLSQSTCMGRYSSGCRGHGFESLWSPLSNWFFFYNLLKLWWSYPHLDLTLSFSSYILGPWSHWWSWRYSSAKVLQAN